MHVEAGIENVYDGPLIHTLPVNGAFIEYITKQPKNEVKDGLLLTNFTHLTCEG